jgi:uncharacterized protein (TIGR02996 family)
VGFRSGAREKTFQPTEIDGVDTSDEAGLLRAWADEPTSDVHWRVLADYLDERGDPRGELLRLHQEMLALPWGKPGARRERRIRELLMSGVVPARPRLVNSLGMTFVLIPPGKFFMGGTLKETRDRARFEDERPRHQVTVNDPFWLGVCQVTQAQWRKVMGRNPSEFKGDGQRPVESITWHQARKLASRLSDREPGHHYRLPTEAEWEYACRAGSHRPCYLRDFLTHKDACFEHPLERLDPLEEDAPSFPNKPRPVGSYPPNPWGLHDMLGNVWEWCEDWFDPTFYTPAPRESVAGPSSSPDNNRVFRGGAWCSWPLIIRAACRSADQPDFRDNYLGMRLALSWRPGMI